MIFHIYFISGLVLAALYIFLMATYNYFWHKLPSFDLPTPENWQPSTPISVLIPARNEAENIEKCLSSITQGSYPAHLFEIIVIDDHSEDATPQYVRNFDAPNVRLIELKDYLKLGDNQPYKKRAIETAISASSGRLIVTTDADCIVPPDWLRYFAAFYERRKARFIAAPVSFYDEKNSLEVFQSIDYVGMMGITGAGIEGDFTHMCNGANLAYERDLFFEVDGFKNIDHVASGDDMLLMQKVAKMCADSTIGFVKNRAATVHTKAKGTVKEFLSQRQRWASKSSTYNEFLTIAQLIIVFFFCCQIVLNFTLSLTYNFAFLPLFFIQIMAKIVIDYIFLRKMVRFFNRPDLMVFSLKPQIYHILYIVFVGFSANFKKTYHWKGRVVR